MLSMVLLQIKMLRLGKKQMNGQKGGWEFGIWFFIIKIVRNRWSNMSKILILSIIAVFFTGLSSCVRCSNDKYAIYLSDRNVIQLRDDGIVISPITPEGPFPDDNHVLTIIPKVSISKKIGEKLKVGKEIAIQYDYADSGYIVIYPDKIDIELKYTKGYWGNHNGIIPLRGFTIDDGQNGER